MWRKRGPSEILFFLFCLHTDYISNHLKIKFEIWNLKFEIWSLKFEVWNSKFEVWSLKFEVWNLKFEVWSLKFEVWSLRFEFWSLKFEVWGSNFGVRSPILWRISYPATKMIIFFINIDKCSDTTICFSELPNIANQSRIFQSGILPNSAEIKGENKI